jgi:YHS domain-containing protein
MFEFIGRILEILVAFAMIRSVLQVVVRMFRGMTGPRDGGSPGPVRHPAPDPIRAAPSSGPDASTLLHQDPVCGTYVAAGSSYRKICRGQVCHFCSEACRDRYAA